MPKKRSLLLIEPFTALPQTSGGRNRIFHTIKELDNYFDLIIWSIIFNTQEEKLQSAWLKNLKIPSKYFKCQSKKILSFFLTGQPYWFSDWYSQELIESIKNETTSFEVFQIESSQLLYLVEHLPRDRKKVFVAYDVSSISFWRRLQSERNLFKRVLHFWRLLEVYLYERKFLPLFDEVIAVSDHDADILRTHFGVINIKVIPNGIESINFLPNRKEYDHINLGYIGSISHPPNLEAIKFIVKEILPELDLQKIKYRLYLAGSDSCEELRVLISDSTVKNKSNIILLNYLDQVKDFYQKIDLLVVPIFAGSGTRIKILESLSFGRPVLTTEIGAEGIDIKSIFLRIMLNSNQIDSKAWVREISFIGNNDEKLSNHQESLRAKLNKITWVKVFQTLLTM